MSVQDDIVEAIRKVYDPEIPVNIYDLGLVYTVEVEDRSARITMTLTSPNCPVAESLPIEVQEAAETIEGVDKAHVEIVWDPMWGPEKMSDAAKLELGMY